MGPRYEDREPPSEPTAGREPLVDLDVKPPQPGEPPKGSRPRRKRLSDIEGERDEAPPQPQAKPQGRPVLASGATVPSEPPVEPPPPSESRRPRLVDITAAAEGQELRPRAGRPRLALTLSSDDVPGLQNILDVPYATDDILLRDTPRPTVDRRMAYPASLSLALIGGLAAAVAGATIWALITVATSYHIGWMAMGVGLLVGGAVRVLGRGSDKSFGCLGTALAIFGCLLGNLLSACLVLASQKGLSPLTVLSYVCSNPVMIPAALVATFRSLDLLFYGIAIYAGYRFSVRRVSEPC